MLGIMQGRLSPPLDGRIQCFPRDTWEQELVDAPEAGVDSIEWIYDSFGEGANPIETDEGIVRILDLAEENHIAIESLCADWFMEDHLVGGTAAERRGATLRLNWLLGRARLLKLHWLVLPFVDDAALTTPEHVRQAASALRSALPLAHEAGVALHLETSLPPDGFATLLAEVDDPSVRVNYDTGNSCSLGYDPREEIAAYGARLGSVHIKDRGHGSGTVALGTGDTDFETIFVELSRLRYQGSFILQAARGQTGGECAHVRRNVTLARQMIHSQPQPARRQ